MFRTIYENKENVLLAAPEGSGKTACAELAILRHFEHHPESKAVYVTPMEDMAIKVGFLNNLRKILFFDFYHFTKCIIIFYLRI